MGDCDCPFSRASWLHTIEKDPMERAAEMAPSRDSLRDPMTEMFPVASWSGYFIVLQDCQLFEGMK